MYIEVLNDILSIEYKCKQWDHKNSEPLGKNIPLSAILCTTYVPKQSRSERFETFTTMEPFSFKNEVPFSSKRQKGVFTVFLCYSSTDLSLQNQMLLIYLKLHKIYSSCESLLIRFLILHIRKQSAINYNVLKYFLYFHYFLAIQLILKNNYILKKYWTIIFFYSIL